MEGQTVHRVLGAEVLGSTEAADQALSLATPPRLGPEVTHGPEIALEPSEAEKAQAAADAAAQLQAAANAEAEARAAEEAALAKELETQRLADERAAIEADNASLRAELDALKAAQAGKKK